MLRIEGLRKTFPVDKGQVRAVQDVNIDIAEGQIFTLLGPSGSGKSTTLRCVAGLEHPEDGEIFIGGDCVFSAKRRILVPPEERPIGMVRSEEHTSELQSLRHVVCRLLLENKK